MRTKTLSTFGYFLGLFPLAVAFASLAATVVVSRWVAQDSASEVRQTTAAEARHVAAQLAVALSQAFDPLDKIAAWWLLQGRPLTAEDWKSDTELFVTERTGLERLIWFDSRGRLEWTARPGEAPNGRLWRDPEGRLQEALASARHSSETAASRLSMVEGRPTFFVCAPVFREGRLSGFIAGQYDPDRLVRSLLESQMPDGYAVTVLIDGREVAPPEDRGRPEYESRATVPVAQRAWAVALAPSGARVSNLQRAVTTFGMLISGLLYVSASMARLARRRAKQVATLNRDLQRKLHDFQTLLDVLPVGIAVAEDPDCRRIWTNRSLANLLHLPYEANASHTPPGGENPPSYRMQRDGVDVPTEELPMQLAARTRSGVSGVYLDIIRSDGSVLHTLSYAAPLFDERGDVRGVIDACVDITARKQLETRLQQAEKYESLAVMAGGIAHDFNNLLTVIIGNANTAATHLPPGHAARKAVREVEEAAGRAAELVGKLLAFTGRFWREMTPIDLSDEVARLLPTLREMAPARVAIHVELAPGLPKVEAGQSEVRQVLVALLANAVEALEDAESGEITIHTLRRDLTDEDVAGPYADQGLSPGPHVSLEVSDTGAGIAEKIMARVFDPFFTTKFVGRGLGLSAVHGIARAHRGAVRLISAAQQGTRVEVIFPAIPD